MKDNLFYLKALVEGKSSIIQEIYQKNFPKVIKFVLQNKGNKSDAEDIFQLALLQLVVRYKKEKFEIKSNFEGYLFTVCKNLWRRELNKSKKKVTNTKEYELTDDSADMALALVEQKKWEIFSEKLELISENCRKILKLFFAKKRYSTIVKEMDYSSETVARQRVFKCKAKLTELVKKDKRYKSLKE